MPRPRSGLAFSRSILGNCGMGPCLNHQKPSIDLNHLSLNKASVLGTEKDHDIRNVAGGPKTARWRRLHDTLKSLRSRKLPMVVSIDRTGGNRVDTDSMRRKFSRQAFCHAG